MTSYRAITLCAMVGASLAAVRLPQPAANHAFKGSGFIVVSGGALNKHVFISGVSDIQTLCGSISRLADSTLPAPAVSTSDEIHLTFYDGQYVPQDTLLWIPIGVRHPRGCGAAARDARSASGAYRRASVRLGQRRIGVVRNG